MSEDAMTSQVRTKLHVQYPVSRAVGNILPKARGPVIALLAQ
jgi:hypothetical protein